MNIWGWLILFTAAVLAAAGLFSSGITIITHIKSIQHPQIKKRPTAASIIAIVGVLVLAAILTPISFAVGRASTQEPFPTPTSTPTATATTNPTATSTPNPYLRPNWKLVINDPMKDNSKGYKWPDYSKPDGGCGFTGDAYQVISRSHIWYCTEPQQNFIDFALELQMKIIKGNQGGIIFRINEGSFTYYSFRMSIEGAYSLDISENKDAPLKSLGSGFSSAIHTGLYQTNTIAMVAEGFTFNLYVNKHLIATVSDPNSSFSQGHIGFSANADDMNNHFTTVLYSNTKVWIRNS